MPITRASTRNTIQWFDARTFAGALLKSRLCAADQADRIPADDHVLAIRVSSPSHARTPHARLIHRMHAPVPPITMLIMARIATLIAAGDAGASSSARSSPPLATCPRISSPRCSSYCTSAAHCTTGKPKATGYAHANYFHTPAPTPFYLRRRLRHRIAGRIWRGQR